MSSILPDLSQRTTRAQHSGRAVVLQRGATVAHWIMNRHPYTSEGSDRMSAGKPQRPDVQARAQRLGRARPPKPCAFYKPQDGHQAGPLFTFEDRDTGVPLAACRGVLHHVMGEAEKFAQAQGLTLADLRVRLADDE